MRCVAWLLPFQHEASASGVAGWGFAGSTECSLLTLLSVVPSEQAALVHVDQLLFPGSNSRSSLQSIYWLSYIYFLTALKTVSSLADPSDCLYVADLLWGDTSGALTRKTTGLVSSRPTIWCQLMGFLIWHHPNAEEWEEITPPTSKRVWGERESR